MSPKAQTSRAALEGGRRPDIEKELSDQYHVKWQFVHGVSVARFDLERSRHNQARFEAVDEHTVQLYTEAVKRGDQFPPVIAYKASARGRYILIDGNHRLAAHAAADKPLDVYEVAQGTDPRTLALMTFGFNTRHGKPTSEAERVSQAVYLVDNGASLDKAAAAVNIPPRQLKKALARNTADRRADEVGLRRPEWDSLNNTVKNRLKDIATDEGFADAANLAYAARLDAQEVFDLVALVNATKSGQRQRAIVKAQRAIYSERIQAGAGGVLRSGGKRALTPKTRLNMVIGQAMALPDDYSVLVNAYAPPERAEAAKHLREASTRMTALANHLDGK